MTGFVHVAGNPIASATIHVPWSGAWFADVVFLDAPVLFGAVELVVGDVTLRGTFDERFTGTRGAELRARIVAGSAGWGEHVGAQSYVNDQGVRALLVAQDAARLSGETLGSFSPSAASLGSYYVRQAGPAARVLEDVIGSASWWVEYDGTTTVGTRPSTSARSGSYQVLEYDAAARLVTLGVDDVSAIGPGSVLSDGLDDPQTVRDLEIRVTPEAVRLVAWTGDPVGARGRLEGALRSVVGAAAGRRLHGVYAYRVARLAADRVELQAIDRTLGLPDLGPTPMWPGLAGAHATLSLGAEVLVCFVNGDRARPVVTSFVGKGGAGFSPTRIDLGNAPTSYVALAAKVDDEIDRIWNVLTGWTVAPNDGGAALKTAATTASAGVLSTASTLVRST
jgi:hypothetical protein